MLGRFSRLLLLGLLFALVVPLASSAATNPDLNVSALSASGSLAPGGTVTATVTTRNSGTVQAAASTTRLYASKDQARGSDDVLLASIPVPILAAGATSAKTVTVNAPAKLGTGELLACADATSAVAETNETNNCRVVTDTDLDGWANFTDCAPTDGLISPGTKDTPDAPNFRDTNCDGVDGNARKAIFVAPTGSDSNAGTQAAPMKTFAAAVPKAAAQGKAVYAQAGAYPETLNMANGVGIFGGYTPTWGRSLSPATRLTGFASYDTTAATATTINVATTMQLLTLAPTQPTSSGADSYGLRGTNSPGLRLDRITIRVGSGVAGVSGSNAAAGLPGGDGSTSTDPLHNPAGGSSPVGNVGGNGGPGGNYLHTDHVTGYDGGPGAQSTPDIYGLMGGPGGPGGSEDSVGGAGYFGDSGKFLGDGAGGSAANQSPASGIWTTANGGNGGHGSNGHGGGGGGGGGGEDCFCVNPDIGGHGGSGGGGGQGGGGGGGGSGGGAAIGILLYNSVGATVKNSSIVVGNGGAGGAGGGGAFGGAGGIGAPGSASFGSDAGPGGRGGNGGFGGRGGDGGGGAGGPSIDVVGLASGALTKTTLQHGTGGAGGAGGLGSGNGGGAGASGVTADFG